MLATVNAGGPSAFSVGPSPARAAHVNFMKLRRHSRTMPSNVEVKAEVKDLQTLLDTAKRLSGTDGDMFARNIEI